MSVGPMGVAGSIASSLPQIRSADVGRAEKESADQARQLKSAQQAEAAAGVGETAQDERASDRDADGRRLWETPPQPTTESDEAKEDLNAEETTRGKDPTGASGAHLDLCG